MEPRADLDLGELTRSLEHRLAGRKVLIVEEEYFAADELARALNGAGVTVVGPFACVEGALAALERDGGIDFGILDANMADDRCHSVTTALTARGVPFVFVNGDDSQPFDPTLI